MRALSNELREQIVLAVDNREGSLRQIARRFSIDSSTLTRLLQLRRQTNSTAPRYRGGCKKPALNPEALERLRSLAEAFPEASLRELREHLGISGSNMIIWRALKKLGITRAKKTKTTKSKEAGIS